MLVLAIPGFHHIGTRAAFCRGYGLAICYCSRCCRVEHVFVRLIAVLDSSKFSRVDIMPDISAVIERERAELLQ